MSADNVVKVRVESDVVETFRVAQFAGMFDLPIKEKVSEEFVVEVPANEENWTIGAIVGPSGSGKTTVARARFGQNFISGFDWPKNESVLDGFDQSIPSSELALVLSSVGLASPPDWVKRYDVLSNGQRFRADLARAIVDTRPIVAFDEFTSVVDRQVAKVGSAAMAKVLRSGNKAKKFVAVSCHYDILEWLQPDWIVDMSSRTLTRRSLQRRPDIRIEVRRVSSSVWSMFARHHYLSADISRSSRCYGAFVDGTIVAFVAVLPMLGKKEWSRCSRIVVFPDWQGIGLGGKFVAAVASIYKANGKRFSITSSHPGVVHGFSKSKNWKMAGLAKFGHDGTSRCIQEATGYRKSGTRITSGGSVGRCVVSFEYVGPAANIGYDLSSSSESPNVST